MSLLGYCLNNPHPKHDYRPINQALKLSARRDKFGISFIRGLIEGQVDVPRLLFIPLKISLTSNEMPHSQKLCAMRTCLNTFRMKAYFLVCHHYVIFIILDC